MAYSIVTFFFWREKRKMVEKIAKQTFFCSFHNKKRQQNFSSIFFYRVRCFNEHFFFCVIMHTIFFLLFFGQRAEKERLISSR